MADDIDLNAFWNKAVSMDEKSGPTGAQPARARWGEPASPRTGETHGVQAKPSAAGDAPVVDLDVAMGRKPDVKAARANAAAAPPAPLIGLDELESASNESVAIDRGKDDRYVGIRRAIETYTPGIEPEFVAAILELMRTKASDIHFACKSRPRVRVDGRLHDVPGTTPWDDSKMTNILTALADRKQHNEFDENHELDLAYSVGDPVEPMARFRVNVYHDNNGIAFAFRRIPTTIKTVKQLGLPESLIKLAQAPRGLVLVCGPTGSGKSTTLAAIIDHANETRDDHIITVEDPIEFIYRHKRCLVNQREVGRDTPSFAEALKRALREDPDIIEVGEMRDYETISIAITAAETGHLVFGTLHTQDAAQTIDRIVNVFPAAEQEQVSMMLSMALRAVIVQTLIPKIGGGRAAATEVMYNTSAIANCIRSHKTASIANFLQGGVAQGMHTMDQSLADLVKTGRITSRDALAHSQNAKTLEALITGV